MIRRIIYKNKAQFSILDIDWSLYMKILHLDSFTCCLSAALSPTIPRRSVLKAKGAYWPEMMLKGMDGLV